MPNQDAYDDVVEPDEFPVTDPDIVALDEPDCHLKNSQVNMTYDFHKTFFTYMTGQKFHAVQ